MYPVDLHMHTVASTHAYSTLHDYIAEAKRKGIKLFAITDHGPDMADAPHYWHFVNMHIWPSAWIERRFKTWSRCTKSWSRP